MPPDPSSHPHHHDLTSPEVANDLGIHVRTGEAIASLLWVIAFRLGVSVPVAACASGLTDWGDRNPLTLLGLGLQPDAVNRLAEFIGCDPDRLRVGLYSSLEGGPMRLACPPDPSLGWLSTLHRQPLSSTTRLLCAGCEADPGLDGMAGRFETVSGMNLATICLQHEVLMESRCPRCWQPFRTLNPTTVLTDTTVPMPCMCHNRLGDGTVCGMDLREVPMLAVDVEDPAVYSGSDYRLTVYDWIDDRIEQEPINPSYADRWNAAHATAALAALVAEPEDIATAETWLHGGFEMHCRRRWLSADDGPLHFRVPSDPVIATCVALDCIAVLDASPAELVGVWSPLAERVARRISDHPHAGQIEAAFVKALPERFLPIWRIARGSPNPGSSGEVS